MSQVTPGVLQTQGRAWWGEVQGQWVPRPLLGCELLLRHSLGLYLEGLCPGVTPPPVSIEAWAGLLLPRLAWNPGM